MATANPDDYYDLNVDLLPCEFCGELISPSLYIEHSTACDPAACSYPKEGGGRHDGDDDDDNYETPDEGKDDVNELISTLKITPKSPLKVKAATSNKQQLKIEQVDRSTKYDSINFDNLGRSPKRSPKKSPTTVSDGRIYDIKTKEVDDDDVKLKSSVNAKNQGSGLKFALNNCTKVDSNRSPSSSGLNRNILNNFNATTSPEEDDDEALSSDDDDNYETIENFWRRAAPILKKRLAENANVKPPNKFHVPDTTAKASIQKNQFSYNADYGRSRNFF